MLNGERTERTARPPGRRADVLGEDTRADLRQAALRLFATRGYAKTTTRMIAESADVASPTLHHHFGKKLTLALDVWHTTIAEQHRSLTEAIAGENTFHDKMRALIDAIQTSTRRQPEVAMFIISMREDARRTPELREVLEDTSMADLVRDIVRFGMKTGEIDAQDAAATRGAISTLCMGLTHLTLDLTAARANAAFEGSRRLFNGNLTHPITD